MILGKLNSKDTSFLSDEFTLKYVKNVNKVYSPQEKVDFSREYYLSHKKLSSIVKHTLQFNPNSRASAKQLLKSSYFDDIRDPAKEELAPWKIKLETDMEGRIDYSNVEKSINS